MKSTQLRLIFVLAILCTIGIISTQIYGVRRAYSIENSRFNLNVTIALKNVAFKIWDLKQSQSSIYNIVNKAGHNLFIVDIKENVDEEILGHFLKEEFSDNGVFADFVFGLHDCVNNNLKYQDFINMSSKRHKPVNLVTYPNPNIDNYYFIVYFPYRSNYINNELTIWSFSSFVILFILGFLAYMIFLVFNEKRLSEIQKDFVKNMTHEFKTPLTSIQLASSVLKQANIIEKPERLLNYASIIEAEARKLQLQVERVLQVSLDQKKEIELKKEVIDIRTILKEAKATFINILEVKGGKIDLIMSPNPILIEGDKSHLLIAFNNLIDNAIKYTPNDRIPLIKIKVKDIFNKEIHVIIKDNGIGIQKNNLKLIFDRFFRESTGNIHDVKGFGIGLNYVKTIVELNNGKIYCESTVGEGSVFTIILNKALSKK
ncbi:MAG TPA: HAMP domain-containing sensor histidine kinase [Edaphocola sp.]|nr:HAMP domain-containing sensor histidine kinase [Edaphocola sp.]